MKKEGGDWLVCGGEEEVNIRSPVMIWMRETGIESTNMGPSSCCVKSDGLTVNLAHPCIMEEARDETGYKISNDRKKTFFKPEIIGPDLSRRQTNPPINKEIRPYGRCVHTKESRLGF